MPNVTTQSMNAIFQDLLFCPDFTIVAPATVGPVSHPEQLQSVVQRYFIPRRVSKPEHFKLSVSTDTTDFGAKFENQFSMIFFLSQLLNC